MSNQSQAQKHAICSQNRQKPDSNPTPDQLPCAQVADVPSISFSSNDELRRLWPQALRCSRVSDFLFKGRWIRLPRDTHQPVPAASSVTPVTLTVDVMDSRPTAVSDTGQAAGEMFDLHGLYQSSNLYGWGVGDRESVCFRKCKLFFSCTNNVPYGDIHPRRPTTSSIMMSENMVHSWPTSSSLHSLWIESETYESCPWKAKFGSSAPTQPPPEVTAIFLWLLCRRKEMQRVR